MTRAPDGDAEAASVTPAPKHARLRTLLTEQIESGRLVGGQFLPSEPTLAKQFLISRGTVRQALGELQSDGLVERIPGKGTLVVSGPRDPKLQAVGGRESINVFAIVLPELSTGHYPALVQSFDEAAGRMQHQTMVCATANDLRRQGDIILQLIDKQVAGVALAPPTVGEPPAHQLRQLHNNGIPIVLLHRAVSGVSVPVVALPYEKIAQTAAESLLALGHRRIAFFASHRGVATQRYYQSFRATIERAGSELPDSLVHYGAEPWRPVGAPTPQRMAEVEAGLTTMLRSPEDQRPTAAFDPWDSDAESIYLAALNQGMRIPRDFSLVSFGGASLTGTLNANMSRVTIDEKGFADMVVQLLHHMSTGRKPLVSDRVCEIDVDFFFGKTLGSPPDAD